MTLIAFLCAIASAQAHGSRSGGDMSGVPIPSVSHGEMGIIARYSGQIVDLALSAGDTNEPFRRVLNFSQIQHGACLWGLMPGSVADEASPFNECSHAYLAAVKKVLLDMRAMPAEAKRATALISRIDEEMTLAGMALIACQFSSETFNTADVIRPNWPDVLAHGTSAAASLGFLALVLGGAWGGRRAFRKPSPRDR